MPEKFNLDKGEVLLIVGAVAGATGIAVGVVDAVTNNGCTPGFWKSHPEFWPATPFKPTDPLTKTFVTNGFTIDGATMMQALGFQGGGNTVTDAAKSGLRATVAGSLNATYRPPFSYSFSLTEVVSMSNSALNTKDRGTILNTKDRLDAANNAGVCPLEKPTAVTMGKINATSSGQGPEDPKTIQVSWQTVSEINTAGFSLGCQSAQGEVTPLTIELIPTKGDVLTGGDYKFETKVAADQNCVRVTIREHDLNGQSTGWTIPVIPEFQAGSLAPASPETSTYVDLGKEAAVPGVLALSILVLLGVNRYFRHHRR